MVSAEKEEGVKGQSKGGSDTTQGKEERWMVSEQDMPVSQHDIVRRFISSGGRLLSVLL